MDWNDIKFQQLLNLAQQQNPQFAQGPQKVIRDEADSSNPLNAYQVDLSSLGMPGKAEVAYTPSGQPIFSLKNDPFGSGHSVRLASGNNGGVTPSYFNISDTFLDKAIPVMVALGSAGAGAAALGAAGAAGGGAAATGEGAIGGGLSSIPLDISGEIAGGANTLSAADIAAAGGSGIGGGGALGTIGAGLSSSIPADISGELASSGLSTVTPEEIASAGGGYSTSSELGGLAVDENQGANELAKLVQQNSAQPGSLLNTTVPTYDTTGGNSLVDQLINKGENSLINKGIQALTGSSGTQQGTGALSALGGGMAYSALPTMQIGQHAQWQPQQAYLPNLPNMPQFQQVQGYADGGIVDDVASWFGGDNNYSGPDVSSSIGDVLNSDQGQNEWNKLVQQNDTNQTIPVESGTSGSDLWDTLKGGLGSAWSTIKNMDPKTMQMVIGGIGLANSLLGKHGVNAQGIPTSLQGQLGMLSALNRSPSAENMASMAHYFNSPAYTKTQQFIGTPVQYSQIPYTNQGTFQWFTHKDGGMADSGHPHMAGHPMGMLNMMADGGHVNGPGNGQSDHVHALLSRDEFVIPADVVASLGGGSSKAGGESLQELIEAVRKDTRSAPLNKIPPAPKHPMTYIKEQK